MQRHGRSTEAREQSRAVIGPWGHVVRGVRAIAGFDFGPQAQVDLTDLTVRWFDHWLKGVDNGVDRGPAVQYFLIGVDAWRAAPSWPPPDLEPPPDFYLRHDGRLSTDAPADHEPADEYTYNPRDPVPTLWSADLYTEPSDRRRLETPRRHPPLSHPTAHGRRGSHRRPRVHPFRRILRA